MKSIIKSVLCRFLILALLSASFQASAGMIGTEHAAAAAAVQADRAVVMGALSRTDVTNEMQAQGLDPSVARERVAAMTDAEVHSLAGTINSAPAGASSGWAIVIVLALVVWFVWYRK
ncbi:MAG: PA2779 family protein [Bdellovibrionales bacterium]|nr:PA2779 family protein [Ramlibacter sp.]